MKYLLDTNICIYIIKKKPHKVILHLKKLEMFDVCISVITLSELEYGVQKSKQPTQNKIALTEFLAPIKIIAFDERAAYYYGNIRAELERTGKVIGAMDLLIGAHAISLNLPLVTNNEKEFKRIEGLKIENWAS